MKIVIAPDSFKESLTAEKCAQVIKAGFMDIFPDADIVCLPVADGGEGTVDAMVAATGGRLVTLEVTGPVGRKVQASYGLTGDQQTAVIEMAAASGLMLTEIAERNPMLATSYGTGEMIRHALDKGVQHIILGIGGSATVDGGMGMAQALGVRFLDEQGHSLKTGGRELAHLAQINIDGLDKRLNECVIEVACDVDNPLVGPRGAATVFGPQKGATPEMVIALESGLVNYARLLQPLCEENMAEMPGGGAAGGMGAAARVFLNARLKPGIEIVMQAVGLENALKEATLLITGEGCIDAQTTGGKAPLGVAAMAKRYAVPVIGIAGILGEGVDVVHQHGIDAVFSILPRLAPLPDVLAAGEHNLYHCARNIACVMKMASRMAL